jgi:tetratricopeptide (TPR) repeat protein
VEEYVGQHPGLRSDPEGLLDLIYQEVVLRQGRGEVPQLEDYQRRFPEVAASLGDLWEVHRAFPGSRLCQSPSSQEEQLASTVAGAASVSRPRDWPTVPGYEVEGELGRGGMGVVYKARHIWLARAVALKMILAGAHAGAVDLARFRTEAEALARLVHPNIVQVYEVGEHQGNPFLSLELCGGGSLDRKLNGTPLPPAEAARLLETLARAVHAVHQRGVIHRDLKPSNVLLTEDGVPKITDFGLAKKLDDAQGQTVSGSVLGTPPYMAPEQAAGRASQIGPLTDVYALGAILYELLTGRPPFKGATPMDTLAEVCDREPVPPGHLQPKVPRDLETICLKALRKDPRQRYAGALELAEDLRRLLDGQPIRARAVPAWERGYKWARRRPAQAALGVAVGLAVLGGAGTALCYGLYADQQATARLRQVERGQHVNDLWARGLQDEAAGQLTAAKESFDGALAEVAAGPGAVTDGLRRQIEERRDLVRRRLQERSDRQEALEGRDRFRAHRDVVLAHAANVRDQDEGANAARVRREARAALAALGLAADEPPDAIAAGLTAYQGRLGSPEQSRQLAAECCEVLSLWAEAEAALPPDLVAADRESRLRRALRLLDAAAALGQAYQLPSPQALPLRRAGYLDLLGDEEGARAARELAAGQKSHTALDHYLAALAAYRRGDHARAAAGCGEVLWLEPEHFWALYLQALCHLKGRQWAEAKGELAGCLNRRPDFFWARLLLAVAQGHLGQVADAQLNFARALAQADDPLTRFAVLTNRGALWGRSGRWRDAVDDLRQAVRVRPDALEAYVALALAYQNAEDWDAALATLGQALDRRLADPSLYRTRAGLRLARGEAAGARRDFERAIALAPPGGSAEALASDYVQLGHLQHQAGEYPAALASCDAALRVRPDYPPAYRQRAETLLKQGNYPEAGQALDHYLKNGPAAPDTYLARGLIHFQSRAYPAAVEAFTQSLSLKTDETALSCRGWAYLKLDAPRLALPDFEAVLRRNPTHPDALCGRGEARVRLGQVSAGVADAEAALRQGPRKATSLYSAAGLYARAAGQLAAQPPGQADPRLAEHCRGRAVALLRATLQDVPEEKRKDFWRDNVQHERLFVPLLSARELLNLAGKYGE